MKLRRFVSMAALVLCAAVYASAATRATFIMTSGDRASGELVFHGGQSNNMIDNQLNLGDHGKEQSYPVDTVAVIDIAGGTPSQEELSKTVDRPQALALRTGFVQGGQFVNIQNGTTLVWRNETGEVQRYSLADVARVYLNPPSARKLFNYTAPAPVAGTTGQTPAPGGVNAQRTTVRVPANEAWTTTRVAVRAGDMVTFRATGRIAYAEGSEPVGPEGKTGETSDKYPVPAMQVGALIGRIDGGAPFAIGSDTTPIRMPADGILMLGINDDFVGDNSGVYTVTIEHSVHRR